MSVRTEINDALSAITGISEVVSTWPKVFTTLPLLYFKVEDRVPHANFTYDQESDTTVKITLWDQVSVSELAQLVSDTMAGIGYRRTMEKDRNGLDVDLIGIDQRFKALK